MGFISFVGNSIDTVAQTFENLFSFVILNMLSPFIVLVLFIIMVYFQYKLIQFYIWLYEKGSEYISKITDIFKNDTKKLMSKFFD